MDVDDDLAIHQDPPSPKPLSPVKNSDKVPVGDQTEDMTITGTIFKPPGVSTVLAKHCAKDEAQEI